MIWTMNGLFRHYIASKFNQISDHLGGVVVVGSSKTVDFDVLNGDIACHGDIAFPD
jgi:hypothetical protein